MVRQQGIKPGLWVITVISGNYTRAIHPKGRGDGLQWVDNAANCTHTLLLLLLWVAYDGRESWSLAFGGGSWSDLGKGVEGEVSDRGLQE